MQQYENNITGLLDLSFSRFVTEGVIKILYVLSVVLAAVGAISMILVAFLNYGITQGIGALILAPVIFFVSVVLIRVVFEIFIVIFRIADYLRDIRDAQQQEYKQPAE